VTTSTKTKRTEPPAAETRTEPPTAEERAAAEEVLRERTRERELAVAAEEAAAENLAEVADREHRLAMQAIADRLAGPRGTEPIIAAVDAVSAAIAGLYRAVKADAAGIREVVEMMRAAGVPGTQVGEPLRPEHLGLGWGRRADDLVVLGLNRPYRAAPVRRLVDAAVARGCRAIGEKAPGDGTAMADLINDPARWLEKHCGC
jgi:hypothetical protein